MEAHGHTARNDAHACGAALGRAEQTFDRAAREDDYAAAPSTSPCSPLHTPPKANPSKHRPSGGRHWT